MTMEVGLLEHFVGLDNPRTRSSSQCLLELLLTAIDATLVEWTTGWQYRSGGRAKLDWLRQFLPISNGIASHDTFSRVFALLDSAVFKSCFLASMRLLCGGLEGYRSPWTAKPPSFAIVGAESDSRRVGVLSSTRGHSGSNKIAEKFNEITAIPSFWMPSCCKAVW